MKRPPGSLAAASRGAACERAPLGLHPRLHVSKFMPRCYRSGLQPHACLKCVTASDTTPPAGPSGNALEAGSRLLGRLGSQVTKVWIAWSVFRRPWLPPAAQPHSGERLPPVPTISAPIKAAARPMGDVDSAPGVTKRPRRFSPCRRRRLHALWLRPRTSPELSRAVTTQQATRHASHQPCGGGSQSAATMSPQQEGQPSSSAVEAAAAAAHAKAASARALHPSPSALQLSQVRGGGHSASGHTAGSGVSGPPAAAGAAAARLLKIAAAPRCPALHPLRPPLQLTHILNARDLAEAMPKLKPGGCCLGRAAPPAMATCAA